MFRFGLARFAEGLLFSRQQTRDRQGAYVRAYASFPATRGGGCEATGGDCCAGGRKWDVGGRFCGAEGEPTASLAQTTPTPALPQGEGVLLCRNRAEGFLSRRNRNTTWHSPLATGYRPQADFHRPRATSSFFTTHYILRTTNYLPFLPPPRGRWPQAGGGFAAREVGCGRWEVGLFRNGGRTFDSVSANNPHPGPPRGEGVLLCRELTEGFCRCAIKAPQATNYEPQADTCYRPPATGFFLPRTTYYARCTAPASPSGEVAGGRRGVCCAGSGKWEVGGGRWACRVYCTRHALYYLDAFLMRILTDFSKQTRSPHPTPCILFFPFLRTRRHTPTEIRSPCGEISRDRIAVKGSTTARAIRVPPCGS